MSTAKQLILENRLGQKVRSFASLSAILRVQGVIPRHLLLWIR